jgi:uncharacterized protein (TIGR00730 family)
VDPGAKPEKPDPRPPRPGHEEDADGAPAEQAGAKVSRTREDVTAEGPPAVEPGGAAAARDLRRLRRKGQDPTLDRGVDAKEMWRIFRIISEFVEAIDGLRDIRPAISMWGSARTRPEEPSYVLAFETAKELAAMGYTIITGGGPGIMEAANRGAKKGGGRSVGLGIRLPHEQKMNEAIDVAIEFDYFFIRKMMFTKFAAGLVIAPGGFGTMDEMFDTLTLIQTRKIRRVPVVLLGVEYYRPLVAWMRDTMLAEGAISPEDLDLWLLTDDPAEAARYLDRHVVEQTWWSQPMP